jgi:hypothetical protein
MNAGSSANLRMAPQIEARAGCHRAGYRLHSAAQEALTMKRSVQIMLVLVALILALAGCSPDRGQITGRAADPAAVPDLTGEYAVNGMDAAGNEYGGRLSIRAGDVAGQYLLQWIINESIQDGAGAVEGNQLKVTWQSIPGNAAQQVRGVGSYTITDMGELYGTRTVAGAEKIWQEKAFPNKKR